MDNYIAIFLLFLLLILFLLHYFNPIENFTNKYIGKYPYYHCSINGFCL